METKARILIVDDDEYVRNTYAQCLVKNHYDVAEAEDWRTAFEKVWACFDKMDREIGIFC